MSPDDVPRWFLMDPHTPGRGSIPPVSPPTLARLIDLAEDAIVSVDEAQRIVLFNRGAERTFGYQAEEVLGQPLELIIPKRYHARHRTDVDGFARSPAAARAMSERRPVAGVRKDGTEFPAEVTIAKLRDGGRTFFNAIVRDVTDRVKAAEEIRALNRGLEARVAARTAELEETNRQLARKNEENETFVYGVSHDLRSPLVNLEGFSQELTRSCAEVREALTDPAVPPAVRAKAEAVLGESVAESIGYIQTGVARLGGIIDALLRLSRAGRVQYEPQRVDPRPIVERVVRALRGTAEQKGATVTVGDLPPAWADPTAAEQVFANLIGNALNYLDPKRPGRVEVGSVPGDPGERTYFVRDNGVGIPAGHQAQLFQAFRRLQPGLAPGEGMGLTIVRRVLERLGGRVRVESAEGAGATFYFALPAGPPGSEPAHPT